MIQTKKENSHYNKIKVTGHKLEVVHEFKYLGVSLTFKNEETTEIQNRIQTANRTYYSILPLIKYCGASWSGWITLYKRTFPPDQRDGHGHPYGPFLC